jgi:hypothetical protein
MSILHGYNAARHIDDQIEGILVEHPITKENALEWMAFARTVETSLNLILHNIADVQRGNRCRRWNDIRKSGG